MVSESARLLILGLNTQVLAIVFTIECGVVNKFEDPVHTPLNIRRYGV